MATYDITKNNTINYQSGDILNCPYTGKMVNFKLLPGIYQLEVWGAEGGYRSGYPSYSGKGGYSKGTITLTEETNIFCYAGGSGNTGGTSGGFNGGGLRYSYNGGGGASDIRIGQNSLYARVIVAGGGGSCGKYNKSGGYGGGLEGGRCNPTNYGSGGYYGTQTGVSNSSWKTASQSTSTSSTTSNAYAGFGFGGNGLYRSNGYGGAGGGGWYGGTGTKPDGSGDDDMGGGGGSGYVYTSTSATNYPTGCLLNNKYYLKDSQIIAGNQTIKEPDATSKTGHYGNGYIRIIAIEVQSLPIKIKIDNDWKKIKNLYQKINGTWKKSSKVKIKINNSWK